MERDGHRCVDCGTAGNHAHHVKRKSAYPDLADDVGNGVTLCGKCHAARHKDDLPSSLLKGLAAN